MITIYGLKNCDTCRKALKALMAAGKPAELVDIRETPLSAEQVQTFCTTFGTAIVNRRSTTWRGLDDITRQLPDAQIITQHPSVMKRPVILHDKALYLGWTPDTQAALGL